MSRIIERLRYRGENEAADYIEKLLAMNDELEYALAGVMHNVDKWLDGDDFDNDEVQRADIMREKVLQIIEKLKSENAQLHRERDAAVEALEAIDSSLGSDDMEYIENVMSDWRAQNKMKDIVERLRAAAAFETSRGTPNPNRFGLLRDAADELEKIRREKDMAVADIGKWKCTVCNHRPQKGLITTCPHYAHCGLAYLDFEWRGVQEDKA